MPPSILYPVLIAVQLVVLYLLSSRTNGLLYRRLGRPLYLLVALPGVVVHELSHLVACLLTGTKIRKVRLFEPVQEGGTMVLGYVEHDRTLNPIAAVLVGSAPFFGGAAVLWLIAAVAVPGALAQLRPALDLATAHAGSSFGAYGSFLVAVARAVPWNAWPTYLMLYVTLSVSTHLAPSVVDLKHAAIGAAVLIGIFVLAWAGVLYFRLSAPFDANAVFARVSAFLSVFLTLGIIVSGTFAALLGAVSWLVREAFRHSRRPRT